MAKRYFFCPHQAAMEGEDPCITPAFRGKFKMYILCLWAGLEKRKVFVGGQLADVHRTSKKIVAGDFNVIEFPVFQRYGRKEFLW